MIIICYIAAVTLWSRPLDVAADVRSLAADAIRADPYVLGKPRVYLKGKPAKFVAFRLAPDPPDVVFGKATPLGLSVEIECRVQVLRRDLAKIFPKATFPRLVKIDEMAVELAKSGSTDTSKVEAEVQLLANDISTATAPKPGFQAVRVQGGGSVQYDVLIVFKPAGGKLEMMHYLTYLLCKRHSLDMTNEWLACPPGHQPLGGLYHYRVSWLDGSWDNGNTTFEKDGPHPFSPSHKAGGK